MKENLSTLTRVRNLFMIGHSNRDELGLKIFQYNFFFATDCTKNNSQGAKLFLRLRSEKAAPAGQMSMPKLELHMPNLLLFEFFS